MRLHDTIVRFVCVILAVAMLIGASGRLDSIHESRKELKLVSVPDLKHAPPALAFATVAMGAFRGLVVDILWMRAEKLKEEGQFFDAKQIAEWITTLQPRFAGVWDFQGWNMAYNISVSVPRENWEERWMWVRNGYELLRDKGIEKNPHSLICTGHLVGYSSIRSGASPMIAIGITRCNWPFPCGHCWAIIPRLILTGWHSRGKPWRR